MTTNEYRSEDRVSILTEYKMIHQKLKKIRMEADREAVDFLLENYKDYDNPEEEKEKKNLTSVLCLSLTCGSFLFMCGMIGIFYGIFIADRYVPEQLKTQVMSHI